MFGSTQLRVLCAVSIIWFSTCIGLTCIFTPEVIDDSPRQIRKWSDPFTKVMRHMTSLPPRLQFICNVQFMAWLAWFAFLFYSSSWISALSGEVGLGSIRIGAFALLCFAITSLIAGLAAPLLQPFFALTTLWGMSFVMLGILLISTIVITSVPFATALIALAGLPWGITLWIPFSLIGEFLNSQNEQYISISEPTPEQSDILEAGMVLGIHNIYIVVPQFISTFLSSVVFAIFGLWDGEGFVQVLAIGGIASFGAAALAFGMDRK